MTKKTTIILTAALLCAFSLTSFAQANLKLIKQP